MCSLIKRAVTELLQLCPSKKQIFVFTRLLPFQYPARIRPHPPSRFPSLALPVLAHVVSLYCSSIFQSLDAGLECERYRGP